MFLYTICILSSGVYVVSAASLLRSRLLPPSIFKKPGILSDIYDGEEYQDFFESPYNISFALNFDGAPKFKSSSVQVWPIQLYVNELPVSNSTSTCTICSQVVQLPKNGSQTFRLLSRAPNSCNLDPLYRSKIH